MKAKDEGYYYLAEQEMVQFVHAGEEIPEAAEPWPTNDMLFAELRKERDKRLLTCDWTEWSQRLSDEQKTAWAAYRKALFDLPAKTKDPAVVEWPSPPRIANEMGASWIEKPKRLARNQP